MNMIGHNDGPTMDTGGGWRRYAWKRARADLLPKMPIEVVRRRVRRARELGLDYKAYAGIRATTGRDVVALLFSDNALRLMRDARMPSDRAAVLETVRQAERMTLVHPPFGPDIVLAQNAALDRAGDAPGLAAPWRDVRAEVLKITSGMPSDGVVVIGETWLEREWCEAARLAGYLSADRYFGT